MGRVIQCGKRAHVSYVSTCEPSVRAGSSTPQLLFFSSSGGSTHQTPRQLSHWAHMGSHDSHNLFFYIVIPFPEIYLCLVSGYCFFAQASISANSTAMEYPLLKGTVRYVWCIISIFVQLIPRAHHFQSTCIYYKCNRAKRRALHYTIIYLLDCWRHSLWLSAMGSPLDVMDYPVKSGMGRDAIFSNIV